MKLNLSEETDGKRRTKSTSPSHKARANASPTDLPFPRLSCSVYEKAIITQSQNVWSATREYHRRSGNV